MTLRPIFPSRRGVAALAALFLTLGTPSARSGIPWWPSRGEQTPSAEQPGATDTEPAAAIPISKLPGPPRPSPCQSFILTVTNAQIMTGMDRPDIERFRDVSGNDYTTAFITNFSYARPCSRTPQVLIRIEPKADTLRGRLEAHRLKPNFAYQIKLRGDYADRTSFETIGRIGRWRLPGRFTNYSDEDYRDYPDKASVEAYVLFDYFITDRDGNAVRDFALDSSLHVLWNAARQNGAPDYQDLYRFISVATDPSVYSRPKSLANVEWIWAEREVMRYTSPDERIGLPPGRYLAELVLTEESFHSQDNDGGFWATVYKCPIRFTISP
jgi:hypothetical protein